MTPDAAIETTRARAATLRALHAGPALLVMPNAWDAASARSFHAAGFPAIATTSGGVAAALGYADHEGAPAAEMLAAAARIIGAVDIPSTVDFEAGYGLSPSEIVDRLVSIGAAGMNVEDSDHHGEAALVDADDHAGRIAALKDASRRAGVDLVFNARVDVFINRAGSPDEQLAEGLRRARLYREAGADCIYPILLSDEAMIRAFVDAVGVINVNVRRGGAISLQRAAELGVRRVTYATSIFREVMTFVDGIAQDIKAQVPAGG
jgi:2-methylisocitrate lyase-like PEP mutase family enzyme